MSDSTSLWPQILRCAQDDLKGNFLFPQLPILFVKNHQWYILMLCDPHQQSGREKYHISMGTFQMDGKVFIIEAVQEKSCLQEKQKRDFQEVYVMATIFNWIKEHSIAAIVIAVIVVIGISGIWWAPPAYFAVTHTNMQDCGYVTSLGGNGLHTGGNSSPQQIIQCFVQAHQQCRSASIASTVAGTDAGTTETFYTANALGQCGLSLQTTNYVVAFRNNTTYDTCSSVVQKPDGLHFTCGSSGEQIFPSR